MPSAWSESIVYRWPKIFPATMWPRLSATSRLMSEQQNHRSLCASGSGGWILMSPIRELLHFIFSYIWFLLLDKIRLTLVEMMTSLYSRRSARSLFKYGLSCRESTQNVTSCYRTAADLRVSRACNKLSDQLWTTGKLNNRAVSVGRSSNFSVSATPSRPTRRCSLSFLRGVFTRHCS